MAVELSVGALISAAGSIGTLLREAIPLAQSIRSGLRASNEDAKQQLQGRLAELQESLKQAGKLADVAREYSATLENVAELLWLVERAERFLADNIDACRRKTNPAYPSSWQILGLTIDSINANRDAIGKAMLEDRSTWYDERDKGMLRAHFQEFNDAFGRADSATTDKLADRLQNEVRAMKRPLVSAQTVLRATEASVLGALQRLGQ